VIDLAQDRGREKTEDRVESLGAYGLRLSGLERAARWLLPQDDDAPELEVAVRVSAADWSPPFIDDHRANLRLIDGGRLRARRGKRRVTFSVPTPIGADELAHPYLAPAAALMWQWAGAEALHAGAVAIGDGAVIVLGDKGSGKSTTLASLATEHGCTPLADDLVVIRDGRALAGPRSLDVRAGEPVVGGRLVRGGDRTRIDLGPAPRSLPVTGAFVLTWGRSTQLEAIPPRERLPVLIAQRSYPLPGDPRALLDVAACPMFRLTRPEGSAERLETLALLERFA
jgi:hypothetical protein